MRHTRLIAVTMALASAAAAEKAAAVTRCVNPAGSGGCSASIQAAVTASGPGDRVSIGVGTYYENVVIPAGKDGLQLQGASRLGAILDADSFADRAVASAGPGIIVQSRNVQMRNFTVRNGKSRGIEINAPGAVVQAVTIVGANSIGITVSAAAWNVQILANEIRSTNSGIDSLGFATVIKGNLISGIGNTAIGVAADAPQIGANRITRTGNGIIVTGDGAVVTTNDIRHGVGSGIILTGSSPSIQGNRLVDILAGVSANCTNCFAGQVSANSMTDIQGNALTVLSDSPGLVVSGNVVLRATGGVVIDGTGIRAQLNRITDAGSLSPQFCMAIRGSLNTVSRNTVTGCTSAAFYVAGDEMTLDGNSALSGFGDGFVVDGTNPSGPTFANTTLRANKALSMSGEGFAVSNAAVSTSLIGNTGSKNRVDFCDEGTGTIISANVFGTTGVGGCPLAP